VSAVLRIDRPSRLRLALRSSVLSDLHVVATQSRGLWTLAPTRLQAVRNALQILRIAAVRRGWMRPSTRILRVAYGGRRFDLAVADRSEVSVVHEMLVEQQYAFAGGRAPGLILDLGSNVGASIAFFRTNYPEARIIGLEPDPSTFGRLQRSVGGLAGVEIHPWAIAGRSGRLPFQQASDSWGSALAAAGSASLEVEALSLRDLTKRLDVRRIDLCKLDVEGAEWAMFEDPDALSACSIVIGELHLDDQDRTCERAIRALGDFDVSITARTQTHANFIARRRA
jgi:FkbM family methyltransferase